MGAAPAVGASEWAVGGAVAGERGLVARARATEQGLGLALGGAWAKESEGALVPVKVPV